MYPDPGAFKPTVVKTWVLSRVESALESAFQFCFEPKSPCMMTMGWERDGLEGDGLGMSLKDRATVGVVVVDMDRTDHGFPHRGTRRRALLATAAILVRGISWWEWFGGGWWER